MASVNSSTAAKNSEPTRIRSPTGSSTISEIIDPAGTGGNEMDAGNNKGSSVGLGLTLSPDNVSSAQLSNSDNNRQHDPRSNTGSDDDDDDKPLAMTLDRSLATALSSDLSRIINKDNSSMNDHEKDEDDIPLAAVASTLSRSATPSLLHMSSLTNLRSSSNRSPLPQNNNNGVTGTGSGSGVGSPVSRFEEDEEDQPLALVLETRETLKRKDEVLDEYFR
ncbi:hypothetical protein BKA69DRAFT_1092829 [Paraphysoderma sedebokerense]|nr:hypothetical protein BKA69DRAFT_1092829 [Paraphysoderma sedebokerense]